MPNPFGAEVRMSNITEELFDTDPSTIEFAIGSVSDPSVGVRVFREDGTEIFNQTPGLGMFGDGGVYENNGVAYMLLYESQVDGPYKVYQLPGHLPCIDCHGTPAGMVVMNGDDASGGLTIFPNPTANEVTVQVPGRFAQKDATLLLMSSDGKVVRQYMLNGKSAFTFSVKGLAGGVYQCILVVDNLRTSGKLVIGSR
ncbi:MAG: T9SS type A sorting domain-containing protein [Flavobacteriales bacterium]|nr:T9SS type A sorting domain-containing protein [Flavobacteriales bacterium]MCB0759034.1 T9SS type A sorting domain-containing protein [Flavobacteriales bacterium]